MRAAWIGALALALGCAGETENTGGLCFHQPTGGIEAGAPFEIRVLSGLCFSGSCTEDIRANCTVTQEGSLLRVTSHISWKDVTRLKRVCTDDCLSPTPRCQAPALPAGTYTVVHGDRSYTLTVPMEAVDECAPFGRD